MARTYQTPPSQWGGSAGKKRREKAGMARPFTVPEAKKEREKGKKAAAAPGNPRGTRRPRFPPFPARWDRLMNNLLPKLRLLPSPRTGTGGDRRSLTEIPEALPEVGGDRRRVTEMTEVTRKCPNADGKSRNTPNLWRKSPKYSEVLTENTGNYRIIRRKKPKRRRKRTKRRPVQPRPRPLRPGCGRWERPRLCGLSRRDVLGVKKWEFKGLGEELKAGRQNRRSVGL